MLSDPIVRARCAAALSVLAVGAAVIGLWPQLHTPAWPSTVLGLGAIALALEPGPIAARATATVLGSLAVLCGWAQIGALWGAALAV